MSSRWRLGDVKREERLSPVAVVECVLKGYDHSSPKNLHQSKWGPYATDANLQLQRQLLQAHLPSPSGRLKGGCMPEGGEGKMLESVLAQQLQGSESSDTSLHASRSSSNLWG